MISFEEYAHKRARAQRLLQEADSSARFALQKATSNLFRHRTQKDVKRLDLRDFNHVLRVDITARCAEVEGLTTYEELVRETLAYGLMPAVVPQLKSITIGGAIAGIGIESSSFRYGFAHESAQELEVLLPDGQVVVATRDNEHRDLFLGFPNSYGTLGYVLRARLSLVPVGSFVKVTHHRYTDVEPYFQAMAQACTDRQVDFVDGTMFHGHELYLTTGQFVAHAEWLSDYSYLQMYYQSIRCLSTDYLTTRDYLWRWDTDWFWCSKHFLLQHRWMRRLWGKRRLCSAVYWKLWKRFHASRVAGLIAGAIEGRREAVIQDIEVPIEHAPRFAVFFNEQIGITPVWICPVRASPSVSYPLYPMEPGQLYVNFGFWDTVKSDHTDGYFNRMIEVKVRELDGYKSLYSDSYYSSEEFDRLYNGSRYRLLKARYDPKGLLNELYEKCVLKQ
jgi:FAD/FMN-containing dehydrogenase